jgi:Uma2 family endonuclease
MTVPPEIEVGKRYEIIDGRRVEKPPMGTFAVFVAAALDQFLGGYVRANRLGRVFPEMLFRINPEGSPQRRPDVAFVSYGRWPSDRKVADWNGWDVVPDLAIEVVSPSDSASEVLGKIREYFQAGVRRVWVVYPAERLVYVYESPTKNIILGEGDDLDGGDLLPGFQLSLVELFEDGL